MALSKEIEEEVEFAKNHLMSSSLDDRCKKSLLRLLNTATLATNGLSVEQKIQKITEAIFGLVLSQLTFLDTVDKKIENANKAQCIGCKAMKHATEVEEEEKNRKLIEDWKAANGIVDKKDEEAEDGWTRFLKQLLLKPYVYVVASILAISPYGIEIIRMIIQIWSS